MIHEMESLAWPVSVVGISIILGLIGHFLVFKALQRLSKGTETILDDLLVKHCRGPSRLIFPLFTYHFLLPFIKAPAGLSTFLTNVFSALLVISVAWLLVKLTSVLEDFIIHQYRVDVTDNLRARTIHTQIRVLRKVVIVVVAVLALGILLMTFSKVRQLGTSILASAGIVGIIVGIAAQRSIATLLAGLQIAITQPIRLDDVVIVENEWGRIEEITLTYVVVRIWDLRRLVVPITYFLERPFQNWTRVSADLLGTVFLYVDYTVPVQAVREELRHILEDSPQWDGQVCVLQVTNTTEHTMELRALMSAPNSSAAWELRCHVREKLIEFVRKNYPESLPRVRADLNESPKNQVPHGEFSST
jgi:small-conductance mechanosensitive channel